MAGALVTGERLRPASWSEYGAQYYCQGFDKFAGRGELIVAGFFSGLSYRIAIVGGTGEYAGARGWETGTFNAKLTKVRFTDTFSL